MSRKLPYDVTTWKVNLPVHVAARVQLHLPAPSGAKTQYAARSKLIVSLLEDWLKELDQFEPKKEEFSQ